MVRSVGEIAWSGDKCSALEIECETFQSNSFAIHPIQHENIRKNSTAAHSQQDNDVSIMPVNGSDDSNVFFRPSNITDKKHRLDHLRDFEWPWKVEIYANGDHVTNGILLDKFWVLVEKNSLGSSQEPLHDNHVVALFGHSRSKFNIESPYEQLLKIDCLQHINDSNVMLLRFEFPVDFNRHVLPSLLPVT